MDIGLGAVTVRAVARDTTAASRLFPQVLGLKLVWVANRSGVARRRDAASAIRPDRHRALLS